MGRFGYEVQGASDYGIDTIQGSLFTCGESGYASSMTFYARNGGAATINMKMALYQHSDLSLVGVTDQISIPGWQQTWRTATFASPPAVSAQDYILVMWSTSSTLGCFYDTGVADQGHEQSGLSYPSYPDPLVPGHSTRKYSIYCDYSAGAVYGGVGQSFTTPNDGASYQLTSAVLSLQKYGSPVGNLRARLYAHSGTYGTSGVPVGEPLAESASVAMADLTAQPAFSAETFPFIDSSYMTMPNTSYVLVLVAYDASTLDGTTNYVAVESDSSSPTHGGNACVYTTSWAAMATHDLCFYVYGREVEVMETMPRLFASMERARPPSFSHLITQLEKTRLPY